MTLVIESKGLIAKRKMIFFADYPFDVEDCHVVFFYGCKEKVNIPGFSFEESSTLVIDLTLDLEDIWKRMDRKSCRYAIKRAIRDGVKVKLNENYEVFYDINQRFRKHKGLPPGPSVDFMKKYGTLFVAEFDGEIVAGALFVENTNTIRWLYAASERLEVEKNKATLIGNVNHLIIWEAIKYAKQKGIKEFDMGGYYMGSNKNDPRYTINLFKKSFGGKLVKHFDYQKYYSRLVYVYTALGILGIFRKLEQRMLIMTYIGKKLRELKAIR